MSYIYTMSKPDTYKSTHASQRIDVGLVRPPVVGRYVKDANAPYGVRFVESVSKNQ